jgi:hypothetical protein
MLQDHCITKEYADTNLYAIDSIQTFNRQIADNLNKKIEILEGELLSLTQLLILDGDLLNEGN